MMGLRDGGLCVWLVHRALHPSYGLRGMLGLRDGGCDFGGCAARRTAS